jgi:hypothetical protein
MFLIGFALKCRAEYSWLVRCIDHDTLSTQVVTEGNMITHRPR